MLAFCWHYLLCAGLLLLCYKGGQNHRFSLCAAITVLMTVVSVVGFWLVYAGPFVESGKTFAGYVTRYGVYSLPIFLFPLAGLILTLLSRKK